MNGSQELKTTEQKWRIIVIKIKGHKIVEIRPIGTYHNGCVSVIDDECNYYRLQVKELIKLVDGVKFRVEKKRVHKYLYIEEVEDGKNR